MNDGRHFDEEEVAEILAEATSVPSGSPVALSSSGVTLGELREIGKEVGIDPERIESAARALMRRDASPVPAAMFLGAPRSLQRTLRVPRPPTDEEWRRVVTELRATFGARGTEDATGSLHSWRHGDFQLTIEPDSEGAEIVMGASKSNVSRLAALSVLSATRRSCSSC